MKKPRLSQSVLFFVGFIASCLLFLGSYQGAVTEAVCPPVDPDQYGWLVNSFYVNRYITSWSPVSGPTNTESTAIDDAFSSWQYHNIWNNCSNVRFNSTASNIKLTINASANYNPDFLDSSATTFITSVHINGALSTATTTFWFGAVISPPVMVWNRTAGSYSLFLKKVMLHELGHTMGLEDITDQYVPRQSVMNGYIGTNDSSDNLPGKVKPCDDSVVKTITQYANNCSSTQQAYVAACLELPESNGYAPNYTLYPYPAQGCETGYIDNGQGCCTAISPILIDISGDGFNLTGINDPVSFDFNGSGNPVVMSWTKANTDDAFLVLDRNGNGTIDSGLELFGNITPQPFSPRKNGFLALAEFDESANGGNEDERIDASDAIFTSLRLWQDKNHNGVSEASELHTLTSLNVLKIDLDFMESKKQDNYGNLFRYRARVRDGHGRQAGRWAWDVFFVRQ